jgi:hypothetical protein
LGWRESERPFQPTAGRQARNVAEASEKASSPLDFATRVIVGLTVVLPRLRPRGVGARIEQTEQLLVERSLLFQLFTLTGRDDSATLDMP